MMNCSPKHCYVRFVVFQVSPEWTPKQAISLVRKFTHTLSSTSHTNRQINNHFFIKVQVQESFADQFVNLVEVKSNYNLISIEISAIKNLICDPFQLNSLKRTINISKFSSSISKEELTAMFSIYGKVESVHTYLSETKFCKKSKYLGSITFQKESSATSVLNEGFYHLFSERIRCKPFTDNKQEAQRSEIQSNVKVVTDLDSTMASSDKKKLNEPQSIRRNLDQNFKCSANKLSHDDSNIRFNQPNPLPKK